MYSLADISNSAEDYFMVQPRTTNSTHSNTKPPSCNGGLAGGSKLEIDKDLVNDKAVVNKPKILMPTSTTRSLKNAISTPRNNIRKSNKCKKKRDTKISLLLFVLLVLMVLLGVTVKYNVK